MADPPVGHQSDRGHVSDRLDFVNRTESLLDQKFVKIGDYLVEESQSFDALVVAVQFDVELVKVGDGREEDADARVTLVVEFEVVAGAGVEKVGGHVRRQQVEQDAPVAVLQRVHLLLLLTRLTLPQKVQTRRPLDLAAVQHDAQEE